MRDWNNAYMYLLRCFGPFVAGDTLAGRTQATSCLTPRRQPASQRAFFLLGDSHAAALSAGVERTLRGKMAFAWTARAGCAFGPTCQVDIHQTFATSMLRQQLRRGDVVALTADGDNHLSVATLQWYQSFLLPLLHSKGALLLLLRDVLAMNNVGIDGLGLADVVISGWNACTDSPQRCTLPRNASYNSVFPPMTDRELIAERAPGAWSGRWGFSDQRFWAGIALANVSSTRNSSRPPVYFLSFRELWCSTSDSATASCGPNIPGTNAVGYADGSHLNRAGAVYLWPYLCSAFSRFGFFREMAEEEEHTVTEVEHDEQQVRVIIY